MKDGERYSMEWKGDMSTIRPLKERISKLGRASGKVKFEKI